MKTVDVVLRNTSIMNCLINFNSMKKISGCFFTPVILNADCIEGRHVAGHPVSTYKAITLVEVKQW